MQVSSFCFSFIQEKEEQDQEKREREFVARREAERLAQLEGGAVANEPEDQETMQNAVDVNPSEQRILLDDKL